MKFPFKNTILDSKWRSPQMTHSVLANVGTGLNFMSTTPTLFGIQTYLPPKTINYQTIGIYYKISSNIFSTYGHQPVILQRENYKQYNILFIQTTSATQLTFTQRNEKYYYDVNLIGGDIKLKVFLGATPEQAIQKYHHHIGGFQIPPFWAMGYHQCRWGYNNLREVYEVNSFKKVLNKFEQYDIPLEAFWLDIDYME